MARLAAAIDAYDAGHMLADNTLDPRQLEIIKQNVEAVRQAEWELFYAVAGGKLVKIAWGAFEAWRAARGAAQVFKYVCFAAGTEVHTAGGLKVIEDLEVGDLVWSRDDETGELALRRVVRTFVTPDKPLLAIVVTGVDGAAEVLKVTSEHPFWVRDRGWTKASELLEGDDLPALGGGWLRVSSVTSLLERETVYNLEVEDFHTYFVGKSGAWVHNTCWDDIAAHVVRDHPGRFPGKTAEQLAGYIKSFAETSTPTTTATGAKIWRRGAELLIQRPTGSGNPGTLMTADSVKAAGRYLQRFIQDNGGQVF